MLILIGLSSEHRFAQAEFDQEIAVKKYIFVDIYINFFESCFG